MCGFQACASLACADAASTPSCATPRRYEAQRYRTATHSQQETPARAKAWFFLNGGRGHPRTSAIVAHASMAVVLSSTFEHLD